MCVTLYVYILMTLIQSVYFQVRSPTFQPSWRGQDHI